MKDDTTKASIDMKLPEDQVALSRAQVASMLGLNPATIDRLVKMRKFPQPFSFEGSRRKLFDRKEVELAIAKRRAATESVTA